MTEALVEAQLKALYELGILDRDDDQSDADAQGGEQDEEQEDGGEVGAHGHFLLALPPAPAPWGRPFSLLDRLQRWSLDSSDRNCVGERSAGSGYAESGYNSSVGDSSGVSIRSSSRPSEVLQPRPRAQRRVGHVAPPRCLDPAALACFEQWKRYAAEHRRTVNLRLLADACLMKRGIARWCGFLHWEKYDQERASRLDEWKVVRACKSWRAWTARRRRVQQLLDLDGRSFANRSCKAQVWRKWRCFSSTEKLARLRVAAQCRKADLRFLRSAWNALVVHAFRSAQAHQLVQRCFTRLVRFRDEQLERRYLIETYRTSLETAKLRRIVKSWRMLAYSLGCDRRCALRVRFGVVRKRFFAIWRQVYRIRARTARLRQKVERQKLLEHFCAWRVENQAMKLASRATFIQDVRIRRLVYAHWVREIALARTFKVAKSAIQSMRLSRVISTLKNLTARSRQRWCVIRELQAVHEKRLLSFVWTDGWLSFHQHQQQIRHAESRSNAKLLRRSLNHWMCFRTVRSARRYQLESADAFLRTQSCRQQWRDWKAFVNMRRAYKHALNMAASHHTNRLLRCGVTTWWDTVSQNGEATRRTLVIRQSQRVHLKTRCFASWKVWVCAGRRRTVLMESLQRSPVYRRSICNPTSRVWHRWWAYIIQIRREKQGRIQFDERLQRKVLQAWHRHAFIVIQARCLQLQRITDAQTRVLRHWKLRANQGKKRMANYEAAMSFYRRKASRAAFRCWARLTAGYLRYVRVCREKLERQHQLQLQSHWFQVWRAEFRTRRHISDTSQRRQSWLQRLVVRTWHRYASKRVSLRRKFVYLQKIYGEYPRSSRIPRMWNAWRQIARYSSIARVFKQRRQLRSMQTYWLGWRCFCRYRSMFRAWRAIICSSAVSSASFKVRHFQKMHRRRVKAAVLGRWKQLLSDKRHRVEHFSRLRFQVYLELRHRLTALQTAKSCYLRRWFARWHFSDNRASVRSMRVYQSRLLHKVLQGWWRLSIHARQEKLLHDAKRIIGTLSYYQEPVCPHAPPERALLQARAVTRAAHTQAKEDARPTCKSSRQSRKASRRMTDPLGPTKYSTLSCRMQKTFCDEAVKRRRAMAEECPAARQQSKLAPGLDVVRQDLIDRKCSHTRSTLGNESISVVNMVTLPPDQQDKSSQHERRSKVLLYRAPAPHTTSSELPDSAPSQTRCARYPDSKQTRATMKDQAMNVQPIATNSRDGATHRSCSVISSSEPEVGELPLYDADCELQQRSEPLGLAATMNKPVGVANPVKSYPALVHHRVRSPPTRDRFRVDRQLPDRNTAPGVHQAEATSHLSLESLADLDVYGELLSPATTATDITLAETKQRRTSVASNPVTQPTPVKGRESYSHNGPIVKARQPARRPIRRGFGDPGSTEKQPLSDILGLRSVQHSRGKIPVETGKVTANSSADVPKRSLDGILAHYARLLQPGNGTQSQAVAPSPTQHAWRVCFEMMRDLRLLRNDFYICELERVFRNVRFLSPEGGPSQAPPESDLILGRNCEQLKLFLHDAIAAHPAYIQAAKSLSVPCSTSDDSIFEPLSQVDQLQYPSLQWVIDANLPLFVSWESRKSTDHQGDLKGKYWIQHAMPANMKCALDKFVPVVKKYTGMLGQFFARGAGAFQHPSVGTIDPRDYRMSRRAFFALMKKARVFPQLFHRRELERAFDMSVMLYRAEDAVNFPEFVELLARCSSSLQWGSNCCLNKAGVESDTQENGTEESANADTVSVVKFLMLIFAMEGRGSVLRKRSEDLNVVIEFLNHQQQQIREHKMKRFKKLLAEQEAARRDQRKVRAMQATSPVAKVLPLLSASKRTEVRPPTAALAPSSARTFDDLTHSWDSGYHATSSPTGDGGAADSFDGSGESAATNARSERMDNYFSTHFARVQPIQDHPNCQETHTSVDTDARLEATISDADSKARLWATIHPTGSRVGGTVDGEMYLAAQQQANDGGDKITARTAIKFDLSPPLKAYDSSSVGSHGLSKNDFLDDILSSIEDVELILHQSSQRPERRRPSSSTMESCFDHLRASEPFDASTDSEPSLTFFLTNRPEMTSRPATSSFSFIASDLDGVAAAWNVLHDDNEDVQVKDPMLDYLTDVARFSESASGDAATSTSALSDIFPFDLC